MTTAKECIRMPGSVWTGCPCFACRLAMASLHAGEHRGIELPRAPYEQAWARLGRLIDDGWSASALREATGIPERTMLDLFTAHHEGRHHRLAHRTCQRILAPLARPTAGSVPTFPSTRRVRALHFLGWNDGAVATVAGIDRKVVTRVRLGYSRRIRAANANAIEDAYRSFVLRGQGPCKQAKTRAARLGYVGPLAWENLEDRSERPAGSDALRAG